MSLHIHQKKEAKRRSLLDAAQQLFLDNGISKTSISEIAARANVAKGTFYLYFKGKDDLLEQLLCERTHEIVQQAFDYTEQHRTDCFADNVILFADWVIDYFTRNTALLRLAKRNFSFALVEQTLAEDGPDDTLRVTIIQRLMDTPMAEHDMRRLRNLFFIIIDLCFNVCYTSIIEQQPDTIENVKPLLYEMIRRILS